MNIEDQVCSLELAQKLKELNVNQDSYAYWVNDVRNDSNAKGFFITLWTNAKPNNMPCWSAFTVSELGEILPDYFATYRLDGEWATGWDDKKWNLLGKVNNKSNKEADARAKMLIYLIENGLLKNEN